MNNCSHVGGQMENQIECQEEKVHNENIEFVRENMIDNYYSSKLSLLFKVFGDDTRVRILLSLLNKELCVCDISNLLNMTHSAISHQLKVLRDMDLVKTRKEGKEVYYSLGDSHVEVILNIGIEHIMEEKNA